MTTNPQQISRAIVINSAKFKIINYKIVYKNNYSIPEPQMPRNKNCTNSTI
jgi:hypothetical protein